MNRAARVAAAAHGGQIVASHATADLVRDELAADVTLLDLGEHRLRDLARPERIVQLGAPICRATSRRCGRSTRTPGNLPRAAHDVRGARPRTWPRFAPRSTRRGC